MNAARLAFNPRDRWQRDASPTDRMSSTLWLLALASLALHAVIVAVATRTDATSTPTPKQEIAVEIVKEMPKPAEPRATAIEQREKAKPKPAKAAPQKAAAARPEPAKTDHAQPKPAPMARQETAKPQPEPPRQAMARREPPKPAPVKPPAADVEKAKTLESLKSELEALKAEHATLEARQVAATSMRGTADAGMGPLPDSFQAVALPATTDGVGEAVGYQELVFSALAKAKGIGEREGLPGTAGVHFDIDAAGRLVDVEIVHASGVPSLDDEALAIVRKAAPFPPPPQGAQRSFEANVNFVTQAGR